MNTQYQHMNLPVSKKKAIIIPSIPDGVCVSAHILRCLYWTLYSSASSSRLTGRLDAREVSLKYRYFSCAPACSESRMSLLPSIRILPLFSRSFRDLAAMSTRLTEEKKEEKINNILSWAGICDSHHTTTVYPIRLLQQTLKQSVLVTNFRSCINNQCMRSKHIKGSKECYLLGQNTICEFSQ